MAEKLLLFVYIIDLHSYAFPIEIESSQTVGHLRGAIFRKYPNDLKNIDASRLTLYRTEFFEGENLRQLAESADKTELVVASRKLSKIFPIQPPEETVNILVYVSGGVVSPTLVQMTDVGLPELWPSITIKADAQGSFHGRAALGPNGISELLGTEPEFLNEFRSKLRQRRRIQSDADLSFFQEHIHEFGEYFQHPPKDVEQSDSVSNIHVLCHLASAFHAKGWKSSVVKEDHVRYFFDELGSYFRSVFSLREHHAFRADWPFSLIVNVKSIESEGKNYRYTPRSDFHLSVDRLVSLLVEVQSEKSEGDQYRMLLQAGCVARLGRQLLDDDDSKPFIVMAFYVMNNGTALRYLVFQPDRVDPKVFYVEDVQDWKQPSQLFSALFDMYNLASVIQNERRSPGNIRNRIESLDAEV